MGLISSIRSHRACLQPTAGRIQQAGSATFNSHIVLHPGSLACSNANCLLTKVNKKYLPEIRTAWENYTVVVLTMTTIRITCGTLKKETATFVLKLLHQLSGGVGPQGKVFSNFLLDVLGLDQISVYCGSSVK